MVDVQFGDDGQNWLDDVGAVESSAQAYLNHGQVDGFCFEMNKSSRGDGFKEGWFKVDTLGGFCNFGDDVTKGGFVDFHAANRDALTNIGEVRTGVTTDGVPNATHHVVDHVRDRSLAIGSGDVDAAHAVLRIAQRLHQLLHALQLHFHRGEPSQACFFKIHQLVQPPLRLEIPSAKPRIRLVCWNQA